MTYQYDAFFSYKRHSESDDWHKELKNKIEFWLSHELGRQANIFLDTEDIQTGSRWRSRIAGALSESRCLVCIWSPMYFQSKWCVAEWRTFEEREARLNCDLVIPARFHDGRHYPQAAKDRQASDFRDFVSTVPTFWETRLAAEFEKRKLRPFTEELAASVRAAPEFSGDFPIIDDPGAEHVTRRTAIWRISNV
ncbi:toll/interleukin-1 receptor domain-containing protein [Candidatus Rhodobacter oscarellae]|uniref:toll/interleukin-1 receptor domain-containing protein n=1 Tax=Candidatus Rhodobacter oscarellae TaxID=1675527 RepID=UPI0009E327A3|nr:toll/interleukin-1 receptor domain-containing protein [Candidatus Rhodobacter lobularis]